MAEKPGFRYITLIAVDYSVSSNLALGLLLALIPLGVGWAILPPGGEGTPLPTYSELPPAGVARDAELVILGNSKANSDIHLPTLRTALGAPDLRVSVVSIGSATMPVYYAVIKNGVLGAGARPRAVVVYATRIEMLTATLSEDRRRLLLAPNLTDDEPVIARKLYGHGAGWDSLRDRATARRDSTLSGLAEAAAEVVTGLPGRAQVDAAFTTVFGASWAVHRPIESVGAPPGGYPSESVMGTTLEDSFILETEELLAGTGVKLVYVQAPVSGEVRQREERRLRGMEPVVAQIGEHADGYIELPNPPDDAAGVWQDPEHLLPRAAIPNTRAIADGLRALGLAGP